MTLRLRSLSHQEKALSAITSLEVRSAIRRRERAGDLVSKNAATAIYGLEYELARMTVHPLSTELIERAIALIDSRRVKALDSIQLATALEVAEQAAVPTVFVSCDLFLLAAAEAESLEVWNPEVAADLSH